jgi:hypothetical protein
MGIRLNTISQPPNPNDIIIIKKHELHQFPYFIKTLTLTSMDNMLKIKKTKKMNVIQGVNVYHNWTPSLNNGMLIVQTLVVKVSNTSTTFSQQVEIHCRSV